MTNARLRKGSSDCCLFAIDAVKLVEDRSLRKFANYFFHYTQANRKASKLTERNCLVKSYCTSQAQLDSPSFHRNGSLSLMLI